MHHRTLLIHFMRIMISVSSRRLRRTVIVADCMTIIHATALLVRGIIIDPMLLDALNLAQTSSTNQVTLLNVTQKVGTTCRRDQT